MSVGVLDFLLFVHRLLTLWLLLFEHITSDGFLHVCYYHLHSHFAQHLSYLPIFYRYLVDTGTLDQDSLLDETLMVYQEWLRRDCPLKWWKVVSLPPPPTRLLPTWTARSPPGWRTACRPTPHAPRRQRTSGKGRRIPKGRVCQDFIQAGLKRETDSIVKVWLKRASGRIFVVI